jgi:hypothetical protein
MHRSLKAVLMSETITRCRHMFILPALLSVFCQQCPVYYNHSTSHRRAITASSVFGKCSDDPVHSGVAVTSDAEQFTRSNHNWQNNISIKCGLLPAIVRSTLAQYHLFHSSFVSSCFIFLRVCYLCLEGFKLSPRFRLM